MPFVYGIDARGLGTAARQFARGSDARDTRSSSELDVIETAKALMLATLCTPQPIEALAASVQMSKRHFLRVFKRATGTTPHSWRLGEKVRSSQRDLLKGHLSLNEIAHAYGFADHAHYSRVFKRVVGTSPSVWRNRAARDGEAAKGSPGVDSAETGC